MTHGFHRSRKGLAADLSEPEREIVLGLVRQTEQLLREGTAGPDAGPAVADHGDQEGAGTDADGDSFEAIMRRAGFSDLSEETPFAGEAGSPATTQEGPAEDPTRRDPRPPVDPAVRRLLPDGHHDDPRLAAEFRRLAGDSVRERKLGHLRRAIDLLEGASQGRLRPNEEQAVSLLIALTDVRLVLAERLGLDSDEAAESLSERLEGMSPDDPRFSLALGYEFLTWLQETLAVALGG